jgi:transposase-like protein
MKKAAYPFAILKGNQEERIRLMSQCNGDALAVPRSAVRDFLTEILREGAQRLLAEAIEAEVDDYIREHADLRDARGLRQVVRNGHMPERQIQTPVGKILVKKPRVNDRRVDEDGERLRFSSKILPPYLRRTKSIEELIPWLYLKGISSGEFPEALNALLGPGAAGLSANTICRLKEQWSEEFRSWGERSLEGKRYVYFWVDGIYFNIRLTEDRPCILVVLGATEDGRKELVAIQAGCRESEESWRELLLGLKSRGLACGPKLAVGDGALGFWKAMRKVYPGTKQQRCWVHKTANVLDKMPKSVQPSAKTHLHEIYLAETKKEAEKAFEFFVDLYGAKHPKAVECLKKDREVLLAFYEFPAQQWQHLRTTNPIESTFATVRLRTYRTKGNGSIDACLAMVFKLVQSAEKNWRRLLGYELIKDVINGVVFKDGVKVDAA